MNDIKYYPLICTCVLICVGVLVLNGPRSSFAAPLPKAVEVVNPTTSPVPTFDVDKPTLQPVHHECVGTIPAGTAVSGDVMPAIPCLNTPVPSGQRLVVEFVSANVSLPAGQIPAVLIGTATAALPSGTSAVDHEIALQLSSSVATDKYAASQLVKLYSDPGSTVEILVARNQNTGSLIFDVTWSGYLVTLP